MNFVLRDVEPEQEGSGTGAPSAAPAAESESHEGSELVEQLAGEDGEFVVAAEKKPLNQTAMMLFLILIVGGAGIYFMYFKAGPQSARAADPTVINAQASISDFMKGGNANVTLLRRLIEGTSKIVEQFKAYPNVAQVPLAELKSNPFHLPAVKAAAQADDAATAAKKKEAERLAIVKAVQSLQLQTVMVRANRKACMINNTLYQEGETVDQFTVDKITPNAVIVKCGTYRFELRMAQ